VVREKAHQAEEFVGQEGDVGAELVVVGEELVVAVEQGVVVG
jgi:hypothetical protein